MKKIILTLATSAMFLLTYAQENTPVQPTAVTLFTKARQQKIGAWICVTAGATSLLISTLIIAKKATVETVSVLLLQPAKEHYGTENALLIVGGVGILGSIPLFLASTRNNKNARLMLTNQKTAFGVPKGVSKTITGLTLTIPL